MPELNHEKWFQQFKKHLKTMEINLENPDDCVRLISSGDEFRDNFPNPIFTRLRPFEDTNATRELLYRMSKNGQLMAYGLDEDTPRLLRTDREENMTLGRRPEDIHPIAPNLWQRFMHLFGYYNDVFEQHARDTAEKTLGESRQRRLISADYDKNVERDLEPGEEREAHEQWELERKEEKVFERKLSVYERTLEKVDVLLGPRQTGREYEDKVARVKDEITARKTFAGENFRPSDYTMEGVTVLSPRELGLCAYAATADHGVIDAFSVPPGQKDTRSEEKRLAGYSSDWYNTMEGIFTDHMRNDLDRCVPWLDIARKTTLKAAAEYENGDPRALGKLLGVGLRRNVENVIAAESLDKSASAFCMLTGSILKLLENHPKLMDEARKNGVTDEVIESARVATKMGEVIQKAVESEKKLHAEEKHPLSEQERLECATDILVKRMMERDHQRRKQVILSSEDMKAQFQKYTDKMNALPEIKGLKPEELKEKSGEYAAAMAELHTHLGFGLGVPIPGATVAQGKLLEQGEEQKLRQEVRQGVMEGNALILHGRDLLKRLNKLTEKDLATASPQKEEPPPPQEKTRLKEQQKQTEQKQTVQTQTVQTQTGNKQRAVLG